jgi:hypothetical protein
MGALISAPVSDCTRSELSLPKEPEGIEKVYVPAGNTFEAMANSNGIFTTCFICPKVGPTAKHVKRLKARRPLAIALRVFVCCIGNTLLLCWVIERHQSLYWRHTSGASFFLFVRLKVPPGLEMRTAESQATNRGGAFPQ